MRLLHTALILILALGACSKPEPQPAPASLAAGEQGGTDDWRQVITKDDAKRFSNLDKDWSVVRSGIKDTEYESLPFLLQYVTLPGRPMPSPGIYKCYRFELFDRDSAMLSTMSRFPAKSSSAQAAT